MRKEVDYIFCNESEEWVHVTVNGEEITCTPNHPFYSPVNGWTSAIDLCAGDILVMLNGEYVVVEQVQHELLESPVKVYNFEVEDFHTYYVSETKVLVHNDCDGTNKSTKVIAEHLGYSKVKGVQSLGKAVYYNPKASLDMRYITYDATSQNGGVWKVASSVENLISKITRTGTFNWDLTVRMVLYLLKTIQQKNLELPQEKLYGKPNKNAAISSLFLRITTNI